MPYDTKVLLFAQRGNGSFPTVAHIFTQITYFSFSADHLQHNFGRYTERTAHTKTFPDSYICFVFVSLDSVSEVSSEMDLEMQELQSRAE